MTNDLNRKIDEILNIVQIERQLNNDRFAHSNDRFSQLTTRMDELAGGMSELRFEVGRMKTDLKQDIDKVYTALVGLRT